MNKKFKETFLAIMLLTIVLFFAIYFFRIPSFNFNNNRKTSKIMETLVTSTTPKVIVLGKTLGIGLIGILQNYIVNCYCINFSFVFTGEEILNQLFDLSQITPFLAIITIVYFTLGYAMYCIIICFNRFYCKANLKMFNLLMVLLLF